MLTPTDFHYLVGILLSVSQNDDCVDFEYGSMLYDEKAEENRDIDITIRLKDTDNQNRLFIGYEAKHHKRKIGTQHVEQLVQKGKDIPELVEMNIVSGSGFTEPAKRKAKAHNVNLYLLTDWKDNEVFEQFKILPGAEFNEWELEWLDIEEEHFVMPDDLELDANKQLYPLVCTEDGKPFLPEQSLADFLQERKRQWANALNFYYPPRTRLPDTPIPVEAAIHLEGEKLYALAGKHFIPLEEIQILGTITWRKTTHSIMRKVLIKEGEMSPLAGVVIGINKEQDITCYTMSSVTNKINCFTIPADYRRLKQIRKKTMFSTQSFFIDPIE
jgi:hypothetical protein